MASVDLRTEAPRRLTIGSLAREALAVKRTAGVHLGRPRDLPAEVVARIVSAVKAGAGLSRIARDLNHEGIPAAYGGPQWWPSTARAVALAVRP